jgi:thymidylate synthase
MNKLDKDYCNLLQDILDNGVTKKDRTGTGTISVFGRQIRHKMSDGFPLLTTKKMPFKTIVTELLWFLRGDTNIKYLVDNDCHIWDGDAYKRYVNSPEVKIPYSKEDFINKIKTDKEWEDKWGELGPIYGKQWRKWETYDNEKPPYLDVDQIQNLINDLKTNPDSRRLMVNSWNVGELDSMVLPPCHYGFQVYTRELSLEERLNLGTVDIDMDIDEAIKRDDRSIIKKYLDYTNTPTRAISLMWNQRSVDTFLGLPFNIASYGLLLEIIAKEVNMVPDELIGNLGDVHLYLNHIEQAKEQIGRKYTPEEREIMLKDAMSRRLYNKAINELMPFGGGMSEYYEAYKIPNRTREPFPLPKLNILLHFNNEPSFTPEYWLVDDFVLENYQSHPSIKATLSN